MKILAFSNLAKIAAVNPEPLFTPFERFVSFLGSNIKDSDISDIKDIFTAISRD